MRIVYVLNSLGVGGAERQVLALASRMLQRGHHVALMVLLPPSPQDLRTALTVTYLDLTRSPDSVVRGLARASTFLQAFKPDLLHSHNFHGNVIARLLRLKYRRAKLISTIHNVYEGGWLRMLAYRLSDPLATATVAVSTAAAERFIRLKAVSNSKCSVLANGIDLDEFVPDAQRRADTREQLGIHGEFVWLAIGRRTQAKDFPNLLQSFGQVSAGSLATEPPAVRLWIAGADRPLQEALPTGAGAALPPQASDCIQWLGLRRDIPALLDAADGFVLSSAWEGMPLALGEAMAMMKPCVATDVGGVRELAGEAAVVVPPKDADALSAAMLAVMNKSEAEREALGASARERVRWHFNIDQKADEWDRLYRQIVASE